MDTSSAIAFFQEIGQWLSQINVVLLVIVLCSVVAFAVFFERLLYLKKMDTDTALLVIRLRSAIADTNIAEAMQICDETQSAVSTIIRAGLCKYEKPKEQIESAMELRGLIEIAKMEKNARILSIIAHVAPLIGLLGTVLGFIKAFGEMRLLSLVAISAKP